MAWLLNLFAVLTLGSTFCGGVIVKHVEDLPKSQFDFIVVGGGAAGNVVANRLSENKDYSVLVLEAGGSDADILDVTVPFYCSRATPNTAQDWNYTLTPQAALNGRTLSFGRGFILGGSSSVNCMVYTRGSREDFDRIARASGDAGWSWDGLVPYMRKSERFGPAADHHDTTGQFDPGVHGFDGISSVSLAGFPSAIDSRIIKATDQLPEFPFNLDMNSGNPLGVGWLQSTIKNGSRSSSATSYLAPQFVNRPNLHVLLNARVTRVLQTNTGVFRTVEFVQKGKRFTLTAKKEAILSGGSVGTPSILLHSGIGNASTLASVGIKPLHDLPSVGQGLSDHVAVDIAWLVNSTDTYEKAARNATLAEAELAQWRAFLTGPLVDSPMSHIAWLRIPDNSSIFTGHTDPAAGPNTAHYELVISNGLAGPPPQIGNFLSMLVLLVSPVSRGAVTVNSSDPLAPPLINANIFGSQLDLAMMREAIRGAFRFTAAPVWADYIIAPTSFERSISDADLDRFIRDNAVSGLHAVGTASMSPEGASHGVVDPDLRVKGLAGLRVVDVSVLPFVPAAHTQAAAYAVGERAADLIKEAWN